MGSFNELDRSPVVKGRLSPNYVQYFNHKNLLRIFIISVIEIVVQIVPPASSSIVAY